MLGASRRTSAGTEPVFRHLLRPATDHHSDQQSAARAGFEAVVIRRRVAGGNVLSWAGVTGHVYGVERSTNLLNGFSGILSNLPWTDPLNVATDDFRDAPVFYRIRVDSQP